MHRSKQLPSIHPHQKHSAFLWLYQDLTYCSLTVFHTRLLTWPSHHQFVLLQLTGRVGARRVGDVEGVRQSTGNWQRDPNMKWKRRFIIKRCKPSDVKQSLETRRIYGNLELQIYDEESKKKPEPVRSPQQQHHASEKKAHKKQKKQTQHSYSTRSARDDFEVRYCFLSFSCCAFFHVE